MSSISPVRDHADVQGARQRLDEVEAQVGSSVYTLRLQGDGVSLLDQTRLPNQVTYRHIGSVPEMVEAIQTMVVRGAPAIGIAGAYGAVLSARTHQGLPLEAFVSAVEQDLRMLRQARPTAVNLMWAIDDLWSVLKGLVDDPATAPQEVLDHWTARALTLHGEDLAGNLAMGQFGKTLVPKGAGILTHCNAGALATSGYGTALGVIRAAYQDDPTIRVYADETRPRQQGLKLTAWELAQDGVAVTAIADTMAAHLMAQGKIQMVVVGADRIAANGDAANKIGTYAVAILAQYHRIPFYVAAPRSTIDRQLSTGAEIPIESRPPSELWEGAYTPEAIGALPLIGFETPAFDVTPHGLITAIITERGIARPPFTESIGALFS